MNYSINDTACQLTAMNEQGSTKLTTETVNYSLNSLTNNYIILSSAKFAYDMFVYTIEFYTVKAAEIVFYVSIAFIVLQNKLIFILGLGKFRTYKYAFRFLLFDS